MPEVLFASLAADNAAPFYRRVAEYLSKALERPVRLVEDVPWQEREHWLSSGRAAFGVVCGLQYVLARDYLEVLAAPVMRGPRYLDRPVYFSDVVVRADSPVRRFEDLSGARFAINEPTSHSGYGVLCYTLAERALDWSFFREAVESGAHERSLELVLAAEAEAAAIDSTVLE